MQRHLKRKFEGKEPCRYIRSQAKMTNFLYFILLPLYFHQIVPWTHGVSNAFCQWEVFVDRCIDYLSWIHLLTPYKSVRIMQFILPGNSLRNVPSFHRHTASFNTVHRLDRRQSVVQGTQSTYISLYRLDCFIFLDLANFNHL